MAMSRRGFTAGLGAALVAGSFTNLLARRARAQTVTRPKRFVVFFTPNGTIHRYWRPTGSERAFTFPAGGILEPIASQASRLVLLDELDFFNADNHEPGMTAMLTNGTGPATNGASIDQIVARKIGTQTKVASLELGVQTSLWGGGGQTRMSYASTGTFVTPDDDPKHVFARLWADAAGGPEALERLRRRRRSVLDVVRSEIGDLERRLGHEEKQKLGVHLESLRAVERSIEGGSVEGCTIPPAPTTGRMHDNANFPAITRAQIDLGVQALACGLTNVLSLQLSHTVGDRVYDWIGISEGHHSLSHADDGQTAKVQQFVQVERWNAAEFGYLLDRLAAMPDPEGGTLLDSTLVLWAKELGDGRMHTCDSVPWVLAGAPATLQPGRYLKLGHANHARVLVWLAQAFGIEGDTFGDPNAGRGPLEVL